MDGGVILAVGIHISYFALYPRLSFATCFPCFVSHIILREILERELLRQEEQGDAISKFSSIHTVNVHSVR